MTRKQTVPDVSSGWRVVTTELQDLLQSDTKTMYDVTGCENN